MPSRACRPRCGADRRAEGSLGVVKKLRRPGINPALSGVDLRTDCRKPKVSTERDRFWLPEARMSSFDMGAAAMASAIAIAFACLPLRAQTVSSDVSGVAWIVDGDTIEIGSAKLRLYGVDAPAQDRACLEGHSARGDCG